MEHKRRKRGQRLDGQQSGVRLQLWRDRSKNLAGHKYEAALGHRPTKAGQPRLAAGGFSMGRDVACPNAAAANTAKTANQLKVLVYYDRRAQGDNNEYGVLDFVQLTSCSPCGADGRPCQVGRLGL